jgi:hypothetical protein
MDAVRVIGQRTALAAPPREVSGAYRLPLTTTDVPDDG